ncbi:caspase family protein [Calothrix sp. PCC 6303]|uniref:caspase family protein n=1 Tax=Calothrix sp. PCC 6303 TaxID=1170562 RepID=UPI0002A03CCD|nr:caspase family protein [Calothrix sp. PCC 6303]AFZ00823.1 peptidase C14 caspase catalytic subunit p20 [Calothrix sp. PCC 6303]
MAKNWAVAIGINQYQHFQPLACAQADAEALWDFLATEGGFSRQQCMLMTDTSAPIGDRPTQPTKENILLLLEDLAAACWRSQDRVWLYFSGYGVNYKGKDYLMPAEGDPEHVEDTGIDMAALMHNLRLSRVKPLILLDINRAFGMQTETFVGQEIIELAQELQIPLIFSCQPEQFSYESSELNHGFFTTALLEGLRSGRGNTLGELEAYLSVRTPELCQYYWRPTQNPVTVMTSNQEVILGNSEMDHDMDAAAIVLSEEIFASAMAAPPLERNSAKNSSNNSPNNNSNNYASNYSQLSNNPEINYNNEYNYTNFRQPQEQKAVASSLTETAGETPPSLPPALPKPQVSNLPPVPNPVTYGSTASKVTKSKPSVGFWHLLMWGVSSTLLVGCLIAFLFRPRSQPQFQVEQTLPVDNNGSVDDTEFNSTQNQSPPIAVQTPSAEVKPKVTSTFPSVAAKPQVSPTLPSVTAKPQISPNPSADTKPQVSPNPAPVVATSATVPQKRSQALSELSKQSLNPNLASDLNSAIASARKIKPGEPRYTQAQENIQVWNHMIFEIAENRAKKRQYNNAIAAANLMEKKQPQYSQVQAAVSQWKQQAKQNLSNQTVVQAAATLIKPGQASSYNRAIEVAKKVPKGEPGYDVAQKAINKWSNQILEIANRRAANGETGDAIRAATLVPEGTKAWESAQKSIKKWNR